MQPLTSRRTFFRSAATVLAAVKSMNSNPLDLPIGLQLYTIGAEMDADPAGTLKKVAAIGYREVETSPLSKTPPSELRKMINDVGLKNPSGHYILPELLSSLDEKIELAKQFGQEYMITTIPWVADPSRFKPDPAAGQMGLFLAVIKGLTLDDWKWNAEQFNKIGEKTSKAGIHFGYHNHNFEFKSYGGVTGYDELIRLTDPNFVKLELDCGWMTVAGKAPVAYLTKYPDRYRLLHIKDFRSGFTPSTSLAENAPGDPVPTELGRGAIHYQKIFAAARKGHIRSFFVEQEPPFRDMPALEAIQVDYKYLHNLKS